MALYTVSTLQPSKRSGEASYIYFISQSPLARSTRTAPESNQVEIVESSAAVTALSITDEEKEKRLNLASSSAPTSPSRASHNVRKARKASFYCGLGLLELAARMC